MERKIKVLMAKPGFDAHNWGATIVSLALRDAGMEVVYIGQQDPEQIVQTAIQEDVDVLGLSLLSSTYMKLIPKITQLLAEKGAKDVLVVLGGVFPYDDIPKLKAAGVDEVFLPGSKMEDIVEYIRNNAKRKASA
ncbi:MAG: cobalamin B12-binding domain-containing protein [Peptococcaceae bacterium]|nr:MAG: cobalamin B12-binding domain-containing protein [Peptococcaceae bacterium]